MKKFLVVLGVLVCAFALVSGDVFAYNLSYSPEFIRTQSRNATTASVDAAIYNPAGLVKLQDGLFASIGDNIAYVKYSNEDPMSGEQSADAISWIVPSAMVVYKQANWAAYLNLFVLDGGATLKYEDKGGLFFATAAGGITPGTGPGQGLIQSVESGYNLIACTLGTSYALNDMIAVSGGLRVLRYAQDTTIKGALNLGAGLSPFKIEETEVYTGIAGVVGVNVTPMKDLNIGVNFMTESVLFGLDDTKATGSLALTPANPTAKSLESSMQPATLALGVAYKVMPELEVQLSYNLTFTNARSYGNDQGDYVFADQKNGQDLGLGAEYTINSMIKASAGILYSKTSDLNAAQNPYSPGLDKIAIGAGASITPMADLSVDFGVVDNIYLSKEIPELGDAKLKKSIWGFGIGVTYKAL